MQLHQRGGSNSDDMVVATVFALAMVVCCVLVFSSLRLTLAGGLIPHHATPHVRVVHGQAARHNVSTGRDEMPGGKHSQHRQRSRVDGSLRTGSSGIAVVYCCHPVAVEQSDSDDDVST